MNDLLYKFEKVKPGFKTAVLLERGYRKGNITKKQLQDIQDFSGFVEDYKKDLLKIQKKIRQINEFLKEVSLKK
jgi:hypothetical protein